MFRIVKLALIALALSSPFFAFADSTGTPATAYITGGHYLHITQFPSCLHSVTQSDHIPATTDSLQQQGHDYSDCVNDGGTYPSVAITAGVWDLSTYDQGTTTQYFSMSECTTNSPTCTPNNDIVFYYVKFYYNAPDDYTLDPAFDFSTATRIVDFTPHQDDVVSIPTTFTLHAYINPDDIGSVFTIKLTLHNIDQNVLLVNFLSPSDIILFDGLATTSGDFYFSTTTPIGEGGYRIQATLSQLVLFNLIKNPFFSGEDTQSHHFVVGHETFMSGLQENAIKDINAFLATSTATTTEASANTCNPISGNFGVLLCMNFLLYPDGTAMRASIGSLWDSVRKRVPWGYFTRFYAIITDPATTTSPTGISTHLLAGVDPAYPDGYVFEANPLENLAGAGELLNTMETPIGGHNFKDVFSPIVKLIVAIAVVWHIIADLTGGHFHRSGAPETKRKPA